MLDYRITLLIVIACFFYTRWYREKAKEEAEKVAVRARKWADEAVKDAEKKGKDIIAEARKKARTIEEQQLFEVRAAKVKAKNLIDDAEEKASLKMKIAIDMIEKAKGKIEKAKEKEEKANLLLKRETELMKKCNATDTLYSNILKIKNEALAAAPFLASMMEDAFYLYDCGIADYLEKKSRPAYKAADVVREYAEAKKELISRNKMLEYKLQVYESAFPWLQDFDTASTRDILAVTNPDSEFCTEDPLLQYISGTEWGKLTPSERSQLALERYVVSKNKTTWQIGRDYELCIGFLLQKEGYTVSYTGSLLRYDDLGRDLIARKGLKTIIIQCKYWSAYKTVHEKHVFQLYGTGKMYHLDHPDEEVIYLLITNTKCSSRAKEFAKAMGVKVQEGIDFVEFPRIKCNIAKTGEKIYHLPMDQQYDSVVLDKQGECFAYTVSEAEAKGFRRAYKWRGN